MDLIMGGKVLLFPFVFLILGLAGFALLIVSLIAGELFEFTSNIEIVPVGLLSSTSIGVFLGLTGLFGFVLDAVFVLPFGAQLALAIGAGIVTVLIILGFTSLQGYEEVISLAHTTDYVASASESG